MTVFFCADTHFQHNRILLLDSRPFKTIQEHDEELIRRWNEWVKPDDIVYHLGDFALGSLSHQMAIRERLNGHIILIRGNHDGSQTRMEKVFGRVIARELKINLRGKDILLRHRPYPTKATDTQKVEGWLIHGHTHKMGQRVKGRAINVNVIFWDYRPVSEFEILEIIKKGERGWLKKIFDRILEISGIMRQGE